MTTNLARLVHDGGDLVRVPPELGTPRRCPGCRGLVVGPSCLKCEVDAAKAAGKILAEGTLRLRTLGGRGPQIWGVAVVAPRRPDLTISRRGRLRDALADARLALRDPGAWGCSSLRPEGRLLRVLRGGSADDPDWRLGMHGASRGGRPLWRIMLRRLEGGRRREVHVAACRSLEEALDAARACLADPSPWVVGRVEAVGQLARLLSAGGRKPRRVGETPRGKGCDGVGRVAVEVK